MFVVVTFTGHENSTEKHIAHYLSFCGNFLRARVVSILGWSFLDNLFALPLHEETFIRYLFWNILLSLAYTLTSSRLLQFLIKDELFYLNKFKLKLLIKDELLELITWILFNRCPAWISRKLLQVVIKSHQLLLQKWPRLLFRDIFNTFSLNMHLVYYKHSHLHLNCIHSWTI